MKKNFKFFGLFVLVAALLASVAITGCGGSSGGGSSLPAEGFLTFEMPKPESTNPSMRGALRGDENTDITVYAYLTLEGDPKPIKKQAELDSNKYKASFSLEAKENMPYKVVFARIFNAQETDFDKAQPIYWAYGKATIKSGEPNETVTVDAETRARAQSAETTLENERNDAANKDIIIEWLADQVEGIKNDDDTDLKTKITNLIEALKKLAAAVVDQEKKTLTDAQTAAEQVENDEKIKDKIKDAANKAKKADKPSTTDNQQQPTEDDIKLENLLKGIEATLVTEKVGNEPETQATGNSEAAIWFHKNDKTCVRADHCDDQDEIRDYLFYRDHDWWVSDAEFDGDILTKGKLYLQVKGENEPLECEIIKHTKDQGEDQITMRYDYVGESGPCKKTDVYSFHKDTSGRYREVLATENLKIELAPTSNKENNEVNTTINENPETYQCGDVINIQAKQLADGEQAPESYPITFRLTPTDIKNNLTGVVGTVEVFGNDNKEVTGISTGIGSEGEINSSKYFEVFIRLTKANVANQPLTVRVVNTELTTNESYSYFNPFEFKLTFQQPEGETSQDGDEGGKTDGSGEGGKTNEGGK